MALRLAPVRPLGGVHKSGAVGGTRSGSPTNGVHGWIAAVDRFGRRGTGAVSTCSWTRRRESGIQEPGRRSRRAGWRSTKAGREWLPHEHGVEPAPCRFPNSGMRLRFRRAGASHGFRGNGSSGLTWRTGRSPFGMPRRKPLILLDSQRNSSPKSLAAPAAYRMPDRSGLADKERK